MGVDGERTNSMSHQLVNKPLADSRDRWSDVRKGIVAIVNGQLARARIPMEAG